MSLLSAFTNGSSIFFSADFFSSDFPVSCASAAKNCDSDCLPASFFFFSRAKYVSSIAWQSTPAISTFVDVVMQYLWFTRRSGTPLT
eukprot:CAMPEP_0179232356 /NCGR_PEP_ID=MMETSP0797-20121207/11817_1 /TAXON_ID=47934 /ORGANISM="Dinophysis acuminata, Strain DAEP01" /LENGTH=86 /DNA_ID=CAMNT_0020939473 /DNA_START=195 /DNA_END=451 /DNA_ORIENTATION=-